MACRGVAQLVEQRSPKPRVVSSSLATPARNLDFSCKKSSAKELSLKTESEVNSDSVFVVDKLLYDLKGGIIFVII